MVKTCSSLHACQEHASGPIALPQDNTAAHAFALQVVRQWETMRRQTSSVGEAQEDKATEVFDFADLNSSPVLSTLADLYDLLLTDVHELWNTVCAWQA